jgi:hypothetical protein
MRSGIREGRTGGAAGLGLRQAERVTSIMRPALAMIVAVFKGTSSIDGNIGHLRGQEV